MSVRYFEAHSLTPPQDHNILGTAETFSSASPTMSSSAPNTTGDQSKEAAAAEALKNFVMFAARLQAVSRAFESRRVDRLLNDRFAECLAGSDTMKLFEAGEDKKGDSSDSAPVGGGLLSKSLLDYLKVIETSRIGSLRTRFCDDFFEDCTMSKGIKQVVILRAGMDTRALRLKAQKDTKVFEVEQAALLSAKRELLSASGIDVGPGKDGIGVASVIGVETEIATDDWKAKLVEVGFKSSEPSAWILEGFLMQLEEDGLKSLLGVIGDLCAPGSAQCATYMSKTALVKDVSPGPEVLSTWRFETEDPEAFIKGQFSDKWSFKCAMSGTPGVYPDGANYGLEFKGEWEKFMVGFS